MRDVVDGIEEFPHSEEAAQRLSRRTHSTDPAGDRIVDPDLFAGSCAEVTAFVAAAMPAALSIGGKTSFTAHSRHGGRIRSRQGCMAVGSPASASSTALRVKASDSPASSAAAVSLFLLRAPARATGGVARPALSNAVRAPAPAVLV
jgi:hypothetical protein